MFFSLRVLHNFLCFHLSTVPPNLTSTPGASLAKGVFGSLTGFTRWHRQYSDLGRAVFLPAVKQLSCCQGDMRVTILPACSSWTNKLIHYLWIYYEPQTSELFLHLPNQNLPALVLTQRVIWLMFSGVMLADNSPICTMAFLMVATASLTSATSLGSSKMPHSPNPNTSKCRWFQGALLVKTITFWGDRDSSYSKMEKNQTSSWSTQQTCSDLNRPMTPRNRMEPDNGHPEAAEPSEELTPFRSVECLQETSWLRQKAD